MNILHVTKKYPPALGGDAVVVQNLQKQQTAAGHKVVIVTSNIKDVARSPHIYKVGLADTPEGLDAITPRRIVSLLVLAVRMFGIIKRERPQVIHTHSVDMAFFVSFAARWFNVPLVHTFHIVTFYDAVQSPLRRKTELWLAKKSGLSIATAPNNFDVQKLQSGGLPQATLLPNGVDITFWQIKPRNTAGPFTFITVGRLESQKGYEHLINAAAKLKAASSLPFKIIIIGDGSLHSSLTALIRKHRLADTVLLAGSRTPMQIRTLFTQAHAAVCTSLYETTPLTILEAWAAGLPVITTPVGIMRDVPPAANLAYITPARDETELAKQMHECIKNHTQRSTVARNGQAEAQKYAWSRVAQTAESLYKAAI